MNNKKKRIKITAEPETDRVQRVPLTFRTTQVERWFVAVHENGYGAASDLAKAIRAAQESVELDAKPTQLALYVADEEFKPTGFVTWANGVKPRLVGLTTTHQGWEASR